MKFSLGISIAAKVDRLLHYFMTTSSPIPCVRLLATGGTIAGAQTEGRGYAAATISTEALLAAGFKFEFAELEKALADLV